MSVQKLTSAISFALCLPSLVLLSLCVYYAGGFNIAVAAAGTFALASPALAYVVFSKAVAKPLHALAWASAGDVAGLPPPDRRFPAEIESIKSYLLSASSLLEEYRAQHRDLLMSIPDILLELDRNGKVLFVNRAAAEAGCTEDDVLGRHYMHFVSPESSRRAADAFAIIIEGKEVSSVDIKLTMREGLERFFEFNAVPLWKDGVVAGCCCIGRDIDERRKIMSELEAARRHAEEASGKLKKTVNDLEEFSLLAVRREIKMQELRERFVRLKEEHEINKDFPG